MKDTMWFVYFGLWIITVSFMIWNAYRPNKLATVFASLGLTGLIFQSIWIISQHGFREFYLWS